MPSTGCSPTAVPIHAEHLVTNAGMDVPMPAEN
jgi:hypothetical protein